MIRELQLCGLVSGLTYSPKAASGAAAARRRAQSELLPPPRPARARPIRRSCSCCGAARGRGVRAGRGRCRSPVRAPLQNARRQPREWHCGNPPARWIGEHDPHPVGELEGANIERVGTAVLAQGRAAHAVAAAAFVGAEIFDFAQRRAELHGGRRDVVADPLRHRRRHRAAQRRRRRNRDLAPLGQQHALHLHGIRSAALARRDQRPKRTEAGNLGQLQVAIRRRRRVCDAFAGSEAKTSCGGAIGSGMTMERAARA